MKKLVKISSILILLVVMGLFFSQVYAAWNAPFDELNDGQTKKAGGMAMSGIGAVINVFQIIGIGVGIVCLIMIGIKYMYGSPEHKAKIKDDSIMFIVGAILVFSSAAILQIVKMFIDENVNNQV